MTAVRLQVAPIHLSVAFGTPSDVRRAVHGQLALFGPDAIVAYVARHPPSQALYLFKTSPTQRCATRLRNVSKPVNLLYVAYTARTAKKTTIALSVLKKRIGNPGINLLPDLFWYRLADFIERRGKGIVYYVSRLLDVY